MPEPQAESALDRVLSDSCRHVGDECELSYADVTAARAELAALRSAVAELYIELSLCRCDCGVSVQPPHAITCARCRGIERYDEWRLRAPRHQRSDDNHE